MSSESLQHWRKVAESSGWGDTPEQGVFPFSFTSQALHKEPGLWQVDFPGDKPSLWKGSRALLSLPRGNVSPGLPAPKIQEQASTVSPRKESLQQESTNKMGLAASKLK